MEIDKSKLFRIPLLGRVVAGSPELAYQNLEDYIDFGRFLDMQEEMFALRIKGDSMIELGIMPGDVVLVKKETSCQNGDIVVALVDNEATVKRFRKSKSAMRLEPANKNYRPIKVRHGVKIMGKVIAILRSYV